MTGHAIVDEQQPPDRSQCWCCGRTDELFRLVRLGNHPEVGVCARCARFLVKRHGRWRISAAAGSPLALAMACAGCVST